jgi:hypothetical protein
MGNKKYILAMGIFAFSSGLIADNNDSATATVSGEVIKSLTVVLDGNGTLELPDVVLPDNGETTSVELTCPSNTVTYDSNGGNPFADGDSAITTVESGSANKGVGNFGGTCVDAVVFGQGGYYFTVNKTITSATSKTGVTLSAINCNSGNGSSMLGAVTGLKVISCGGKVIVDDSATTAGSYSGSFELAVVYD